MKTTFTLLAGVLTLAAAHATPLPITNAGFENTSGHQIYNEFSFGVPVGWSLYDPASIAAQPAVYVGTLQPNGTEFFPELAPEGSRVLILYNGGRKGDGAYGVQQTLGTFLEANTSYVLSVRVGNITSGTSVDGTFFDLSSFPGYRVELLAGTDVIASDVDGLSLAEGAWGLSTVQFTTGATVTPGLNLGIRLVNRNLPGLPDNEVDFDDVQLTAVAVPEPAAGGLLAAGALALLAARRRQFRAR